MPQAEIDMRLSLRQSNGISGQHHLARGHVEIMRQGVADNFRLLVDFLRHEVAMVALVDQERRRVGFQHRALDRRTHRIVNCHALAAHLDPVAPSSR